MQPRIRQVLTFGLTFLLGVGLSCFFLTRRLPTLQPVPPPPAQLSNRSDEILRVLMPNGTWADETQLPKFDRVEAVRALKEAQRFASGERAVGIIFLLAALREDYETNREKLVESLKECRHLTYPNEAECADYVSSYLMELARRGDMSLLPAIFSVNNLADGDLAESLGSFYSVTLKDHTREFLLALSSHSRPTQEDFCVAAAYEDGGGMDDERYFEVKHLLKTISVSKNDPLSALAYRCLRAVERTRVKTLQQRPL